MYRTWRTVKRTGPLPDFPFLSESHTIKIGQKTKSYILNELTNRKPTTHLNFLKGMTEQANFILCSSAEPMSQDPCLTLVLLSRNSLGLQRTVCLNQVAVAIFIRFFSVRLEL